MKSFLKRHIQKNQVWVQLQKKIFQEINNKPEAILNFKNIEFMSRSFAQEYVFQKHNCNTKITEVNMSESIKQLLYIVSEDFEKTCLRQQIINTPSVIFIISKI